MKTKIKTKTIASSIGLSFLMLIFYALPTMAMANPASEYCVSVGGTLEIRAQEDGGQYGVCVFNDGSECEEWALYNGECHKGLIQEEIKGKNIRNQETIIKLREIYAKLNGISQKEGNRMEIQKMAELDQKINAQNLGVEKSMGLFGALGTFLVPETQDLETDQVGILPDSKFYLFKEISRKIKMAFTFNSIKKVKLQQRFANEKLIEAKKVYEKNEDPEQTEKLLEEYNEEVGLIAERIEKIEKNPKNQGGIDNLLNNLIDHLTKREKVVQDIQGKLENKLLENKLSLEKYEKINNQLDWTVEKLGVKIKQLEGNRESLKERFVKIAEEQEGSEFKNFKNLEILKDLEEKMPSGTSEAIKEAREKIKEKFIRDMGEANTETRMNFQNYLDEIKGSSIRHLEIIQEIASEEIPPEVRAEIEKAKEKTVEKIEKEMKKMKSKQQRENFLKVLENPEIEKLRVIKELENKLPSEFLNEIKEVKEKNIRSIQQKIKNNSAEQKEFIEKAKQYHDVSQFEILEEIGTNVNGKIKQVVDEAIDKSYEELENDIERAEGEENKRKILEKLTTDQPRHIEALKEVQKRFKDKIARLENKLPDQSAAPDVLNRVLEMQVEKINSRIENIDDRVEVEKIKEQIQNDEEIKKEIIKRIPQFERRIEEKRNLTRGYYPSILKEELMEKACKNLCGDGICQEIVCLAIGCPCAETAETCPEDCKNEIKYNLDEYYSNIDYSCNTDSDCEIKDVHNCCGYYPKCVNKSAKVDPDYVRKSCTAEKMGSVCGFPSIDSCRCVQNKCEGFLK